MKAHVATLENTLQKTYQWIKEIQMAMGSEDLQEAYAFFRATLHALRDRLPVEIAAKFGAQLPMLVRGIYYEGWKPSSTPIKVSHVEDFLELVEAYLHNPPLEVNTEEAVKAVFAVITNHLTEGEIIHLLNVLPTPMVPLWPVASL